MRTSGRIHSGQRPVLGRLFVAMAVLAALAWAVLAGAQIVRTSPNDRPAAPPRPILRLGDVAPPLAAETWVRGEPKDLRAPDRITVVLFWASWCPSCRAAMPLLDRLADELGKKAQFVALTHESAQQTETFVQQAGLQKVLTGTDPQKRWARDWYGPLTEGDRRPRALPFAVIVGHDPSRGPGTVLWAGAVLDQNSATPFADFEDAVRRVAGGTYDLSSAISGELVSDQVRTLSDALYKESQRRRAPVLDSLVIEFSRLPVRAEIAEAVVLQMNNLAWGLTTDEVRTPERFAVAHRAIEVARAHAGDDNPLVTDTYARILFEDGKFAEAVEAQRRAVERAEGTDAYLPFRNTLRRYQESAGLPVDSLPGRPAAPDSSAPKMAWSGNLNQAGDPNGPLPMMLVGPIHAADSSEAGAWMRELRATRDRFYPQAGIKSPDEVTEEDRLKNNLVLYGAISANPLSAEVLRRSGVELGPDGATVGGIRIPASDPTLIIALPNPWHPLQPLRVYTSLRDSTSHNLNQFRHGGTSIMVGQWKAGSPAVISTLDLKPRPLEGAEVAQLEIGPETLSAAEAVEDLKLLDSLLAKDYAGYPDLDWAERQRGRSWETRTQTFIAELQERPQWISAEFFDFLTRFLSPVQDHHFRMRFVGPNAGAVEIRQAGFIQRTAVFFADVRVVGPERRLIGLGAERAADEGARLLGDVPVVGTPDDVREGTAYLFPTLPQKGDPAGAPVFLLGRFDRDDAAPPPLSVRVERAAGSAGPRKTDLSLPVHRGRVGGTGVSNGNWRLFWPPAASLPTLVVGSMEENVVRRMPASADTLRKQPAVLLDLRGNSGGSDSPAIAWCRRMSGQSYDWIASIQPRTRQTDPLRRYLTRLGGRMDPETDVGTGMTSAPDPYAGRLVVLVDKLVASSGETFTQMAAQVLGAVLVGENTAGCVDYGNVERKDPLPHSGILVAFGRTRFIEDWVRSSREGLGFFPDFWLDTTDPVKQIVAWLGEPAAARTR